MMTLEEGVSWADMTIDIIQTPSGIGQSGKQKKENQFFQNQKEEKRKILLAVF